MRRLALACCFALAACDAADGSPEATDSSAPVPANEPDTETARPAAPESLVGEYRAAGIDGEPLDAPIGIALSISQDTIGFGPGCAEFSWSYSYEGGALRMQDRAGPERTDPMPEDCAAEVLPVHIQLARALDEATRAARDPSNAIVLSGGGHRITLYSQ